MANFRGEEFNPHSELPLTGMDSGHNGDFVYRPRTIWKIGCVAGAIAVALFGWAVLFLFAVRFTVEIFIFTHTATSSVGTWEYAGFLVPRLLFAIAFGLATLMGFILAADSLALRWSRWPSYFANLAGSDQVTTRANYLFRDATCRRTFLAGTVLGLQMAAVYVAFFSAMAVVDWLVFSGKTMALRDSFDFTAYVVFVIACVLLFVGMNLVIAGLGLAGSDLFAKLGFRNNRKEKPASDTPREP